MGEPRMRQPAFFNLRCKLPIGPLARLRIHSR